MLLEAISTDLEEDRSEDLLDWVGVAEAIGATAEPELVALAKGLGAEGLDTARPALIALLGSRPPGPPLGPVDIYRASPDVG